MKKKTIIKLMLVFFILTILISAGIIYLNEVFLPTKIKSLIIEQIEKQTQKKASLDSVQFNILRGLILKNLNIYNEAQPLIQLKEASASFLILPLIKEKKLIIPGVKITELKIFLERKTDNTFNLLELIPKDLPTEQKPNFSVVVLKINILHSSLDFKDNTFTPAVSKNVENINLSLGLALPLNVKYSLRADIKSNPSVNITSEGTYKIPENELLGTAAINNLSPQEFSIYVPQILNLIKGGTLDTQIKFNYKKDSLLASADSQIKSLVFLQDKITGKLDAGLKANIQYGLKDNALKYNGNLSIANLDLSGIEQINTAQNISGNINFNQDELDSPNLKLTMLGLPFSAKLKLTNFTAPLINASANCDINLTNAQKIIAENFKISLPVNIKGEGKLNIDAEIQLPLTARPKINGKLEISSATIGLNQAIKEASPAQTKEPAAPAEDKTPKLFDINAPLTNINGLLEFNLTSAHWENLTADYLENSYKSSGAIKNFTSPNITLTLSSQKLKLDSEINIKDKLINISRLKGNYETINFASEGTLNISNINAPYLKATAGINLILEDIKNILPQYKTLAEQIKPIGNITADINIEGNAKDFKNCVGKAKISTPTLSLYGFNISDFFINYAQADGLGELTLLSAQLYEGKIEALGKINFAGENSPFWINILLDGLKIEKLKLDTALKSNDISGTVQMQTKLNGFLTDFNKLSGAGKIIVLEGKLMSLNLFKGIGQLIFTREFSDIVFKEASCDFFVKDKFVFTENLKLDSSLITLSGGGKIGFDSSLDASLNVAASDEMIPLSDSYKALTSALIGEAGRFAVITLSGTLKEPKYKFKPVVGEVLKTLKDTILEGIGSIFGR